MILSQARKLKVGDVIYHRHCRDRKDQQITAKVVEPVQEWGKGLDRRWSIKIHCSDTNIPHVLSGKYAFNYSLTPTP